MGYYINIYIIIYQEMANRCRGWSPEEPSGYFWNAGDFCRFPPQVAPRFGTPTAKLANFAWRISICEMMHIDAFWCILHVIMRKGLILAKFEWSRHVPVMFFLISDCSFGTKLHPIGIFLKGQGNCRKLVKPMKVIGGDLALVPWGIRRQDSKILWRNSVFSNKQKLWFHPCREATCISLYSLTP